MSQVNEISEAANVSQNREDDCSRAFAEMKRLQSEAYEASRRSSEATRRWEAACRAKAFADAPEIESLIANVERLEMLLAKAKAAVRAASTSAGVEHMFRRWTT